MPKSKNTKSKPTTKFPHAKRRAVETKKSAETVSATPDQSESSETAGTTKPKPANSYRLTKPAGLSHQQKAALAQRVMVLVADLADDKYLPLGKELDGIDRRLMAEQLSAWLSYLPGAFWDARLPQPSRARGKRKL